MISSAKFTGATMGAIMCMYAFCAQGAQPTNAVSHLIAIARGEKPMPDKSGKISKKAAAKAAEAAE